MSYTQLFSDVVKHIETIVLAGGYPFLFFSVLLEGIPLIGTLVPGHVALVVAGFFVRVGTFNIWVTVSLAIVGAVLGDYIGFALGRKYGLSLIDRLRPFFFITQAHIEKAQKLLAKHTGKAMILGRLSPMTRALMPFLVGTNRSPAKQFWIFNIIGGVIWAVLSLLLGYVFGAGYQAAAGYTGKVILIVIGLTIVIMWGYEFVNARFNIFKKYELFMLILNLISLWVLAQIIQDWWTVPPQFVDFDVRINELVSSHMTLGLAHTAAWISAVGSNIITVAVGIVVALVLSIQKKWRSVSVMLIALASTAVAVEFAKQFFMSPRPENALQHLTDPSFPSAHAAFAAAFFLVIAYLVMPKIHSWILRESFFVLCVLCVIAIGLSRIFLNVHWATDVIAGWALGFFCATGSVLLVRYIGALFHRKIIE